MSKPTPPAPRASSAPAAPKANPAIKPPPPAEAGSGEQVNPPPPANAKKNKDGFVPGQTVTYEELMAHKNSGGKIGNE